MPITLSNPPVRELSIEEIGQIIACSSRRKSRDFARRPPPSYTHASGNPNRKVITLSMLKNWISYS
jgi:hypothetical protein